MGMSASQARLLSITARLTSNEYESQFLTNSKMRLSSKTQEASNEYIQALNSKKYQFTYYNSSGEAQDYDLTAGYLYTYSDLKNQYQIRKASGVNLVSTTDAKNYEETDSLYDFLECYGLVDSVVTETTKTEHIVNPEYTEWQTKYAEWQAEEPQESTYITENEVFDHYEEVETGETQTVTTRKNTSPIYAELTKKLSTCFSEGGAISGKNCYMHVLSALIGVGEHTTTNGDKYVIHYTTDLVDDGKGGTTSYGWNWNSYNYPGEEIGDDLRNTLKGDALSTEAYDGVISADYGDVICTGTGEDANKYVDCYQKIVDLLYEVSGDYNKNGTDSSRGEYADPDHLAEFFYFIEFDLGSSYYDTKEVPIKTQQPVYRTETTINTEKYNADHDAWEAKEPTEPDQYIDTEKVVTEQLLKINDKDKGQWYVNLWNLMNGSDSANCVTQKQADESVWPNETEYWAVEGTSKSKTGGNYEAIEDNLLNSSEWLSNALKLGTVTLIKPQYSTSNENLGSANERIQDRYYWDEMSLSSSVDITEVDDEEAISKAEAVYQRKVDAIEEEDDSYTQKIKRLDTEHTSLQTEYSSVQSEMNKNIERSYKTFSA